MSKQTKLDRLDDYYDIFLGGNNMVFLNIDAQGYEVAALLHGTKLFDSTHVPEVIFFEY